MSYLSLIYQPFHGTWRRGWSLDLLILCIDRWTNKQNQKLNIPDPPHLIFEPKRLNKLCLTLLPAGKFQVSVEKHQYLDDCIFFPNAHNILRPGNIYGLSSEITNWICRRAHRENVWRMASHYSPEKVIAHSPNFSRGDSENTEMGREGIMSLPSPWSFSRIYHLDRAICIWIEPALKFPVYVLPMINKGVPGTEAGLEKLLSPSPPFWMTSQVHGHLSWALTSRALSLRRAGQHLGRCRGRITERLSAHFSPQFSSLFLDLPCVFLSFWVLFLFIGGADKISSAEFKWSFGSVSSIGLSVWDGRNQQGIARASSEHSLLHYMNIYATDM